MDAVCENRSYDDSFSECPVCLGIMENPRYLGCLHTFCTSCLQQLQSDDHIRCPLCRLYTPLGQGQSLEILPKVTRVKKQPLGRCHVLDVNGFITSLCIDEENRRILAATDNFTDQIQIFNFEGKKIGGFDFEDLSGQNLNMDIDDLRGDIVISNQSSVHVFDSRGIWLWAVTDFNAEYNDVCYDKLKDRYLLADRSKNHIVSVDPETRDISEYRDGHLDCAWALGVSKTNRNLNSGKIVVNDSSKRIKFFSRNMSYVEEVSIGAELLGSFTSVCGISIDSEDRVLACDSGAKRVVSISQKGDWHCLLTEEDFGFETPHVLKLSQSGLLVVTSFIHRNGESCTKSTLHIIEGYN